MIRVKRDIAVHTNDALPVNVQDRTTDAIILPMANVLGSTTMAVTAILNSYTIEVTLSVGFAVGQHLRIVDVISDRFYVGTILAIAGTLITLDTQIDFEYAIGSTVTISNINLAVDGSITPVIFKARTAIPSIPSLVDFTRMIITGVTDTPVNLTLFGNLPALTRGLTLRLNKIDHLKNIFNVHTNAGIVDLAYDFTVYEALNPAQGIDGFASRLTFSGEDKLGVVLRIGALENVEVVVQDDLSDLSELTITLGGHVVEEDEEN